MFLDAPLILTGFWLYGLLGLPLLMAALYLVFFVATILAARLERVFIHEWRPLENSAAPALDPYHQEMDRQAAALGFTRELVQRHVKHDLHSTVWRSPDGRAVALIASGKLLSLPVRRTMLTSQTPDGRYLETMDESTHSHARIANIMLLMNPDFYELWHNHAQRLAVIESTVSIRAGQTFAFMKARADAQTRFLIDAGLSEFVDPAQTVHRHTWSGSFRVALTNAGSSAQSPRHSTIGPESSAPAPRVTNPPRLYRSPALRTRRSARQFWSRSGVASRFFDSGGRSGPGVRKR